MDKNYYEILEIDKNASPEIIEKAYKTLAKKYHPDVQLEENKKQSEEIFKQINEAYEILSDTTKKEEYNKTIILNFVKIEDFNILKNENKYLKNQNMKLQALINHNSNNNYQPTINTNYQNNQPKNNYTYKTKTHLYTKIRRPNIKKNNFINNNFLTKLPNTIKNLISVLLTIAIIAIILNIPFIKNIITNNIIFKSIYQFFN